MVHRIIAGRRPRHIPPLVDIARDLHPLVAVQKSAQVGLTELEIDGALWAANTLHAGRGHALFLMPTQGQMDDLVQARVDPAIQQNPYLRGQLATEPPRRKGADSKRLKLFRNGGKIFFCGADSKRNIASVDADVVFGDEYDQMPEGTLELMQKRVTSSSHGLIRVFSTSRYREAGINGLFLRSNRCSYLLVCQSCGHEQPLTFRDNIDRHRQCVVCRACGAPMDVTAPGRWVATAPTNTAVHGYHLSRLHLPWANIPEIVEASEARAPFAVQEFQNSDLGETYAPPGARLTLHDIDHCRQEYELGAYAGQPCVIGIDTGSPNYVVIREHPKRAAPGQPPAPARLWFAGEAGWDQLDGLWERFDVRRCVIDGQSEMHAAREFARRHLARARLAYYGGPPGHERQEGRSGEPNIWRIQRTEALDEVMERFRSRSLALPRDARNQGGRVKDGQGEYYRQLRAPQRTLERDAHGNLKSSWDDFGKDDHYAHAELYCMFADKDLAAGGSSSPHSGVRLPAARTAEPPVAGDALVRPARPEPAVRVGDRGWAPGHD